MNRKIKNLQKSYYDMASAQQVLGALMMNPTLITDNNKQLDKDDFNVNRVHSGLFVAIHNLAIGRVKTITATDIDNYLLESRPTEHSYIFGDKGKGYEVIEAILEDLQKENFEYYYNNVRKLSLMRKYIGVGIDVSEILNKDVFNEDYSIELYNAQKDNFDRMDIRDIIKWANDKLNIVENEFLAGSGQRTECQVSQGIRQMYEELKVSPSWGINAEFEELTNIYRGYRKGCLFIESRISGGGKTRGVTEKVIRACCPKYWSFKDKCFIKNPSYLKGGLYIGTEMSISEIQSMCLAFVSGVSESKIKDQELTAEEEDRIMEAMNIIEATNWVYIDEEDYDIAFLRNKIDFYKRNYDIDMVVLDYIELTPALMSEYANLSKGNTPKTNQLLLNLSKAMKNLAREYDIIFVALTQISSQQYLLGYRDNSLLPESKSILNKADGCCHVLPPSPKELKLITPLLEKKTGFYKADNIVGYFIYKNRGGNQHHVILWCNQDLGTMETNFLFATDYNYKPIKVTGVVVDFEV